MEILIIGGIIVALMVYASTKIKKEAKAAYEREAFTAEHFTITKPEDFLIPINEDSPYFFEAHSRDFGTEEARDIYQCAAQVSASDSPKEDFSEGEILEGDISFHEFRKIIVDLKSEKSYELKIRVLTDFLDRYREKIKELLDSFSPKKL